VPPGVAPRSPARPRPAPSASCSGPAAPANRPGTPGTPAAAPATQTNHQTGPRTPPTGPAPQDTARVASSHTPGHHAPPHPDIPPAHYKVNKLPLQILNGGGYKFWLTAGAACACVFWRGRLIGCGGGPARLGRVQPGGGAPPMSSASVLCA